MNIKHLQVGDSCLNLANINYVQRFADGTIAIHFFGDERLMVEGLEADSFWNFYTGHLNGTKRITVPVVQLPEVTANADKS